MVCLITRWPANPTTAPGSTRITSPCIAKEAETPPVVGSVRMVMKGMLARRSWAIAAEVLAICISERTPSCIRAPPEVQTSTRGIRLSAERRARRAIFSPTTDPIEPPMNAKFITPRWKGIPSISAAPV